MAVDPRTSLLLAVLAFASACAAPPPALQRPRVDPVVRYTLAAVPGAAGAARPADDSPQRLHIQLVALADPVDGPAVELAAAAITSESGAPFRGAGTLPAGTRWLDGEPAARWREQLRALEPHEAQQLGSADAVVVRGLVTMVHVAADLVPELHFDRAPHEPAAAVRLVRVAATGARDEIHVRERLGAGACAVLYVPAPAGAVSGHAVLVEVAGVAADDAVAAAFAAATAPAGAGAVLPAPWRQAFAAVGEHNRRPALLALARPLGCARVADVLLTADEAALVDITRALVGVAPDADDVAWQLERAVWSALVPRLERDELPPAMYAAVARHFGAAVADPTAVRLALTTSASGDEFAAAVVAANRDALGDRDAAHRVRAHDWLAARGHEVRGYAPLAPAAERRDALRRDHAAAAAGGR